MKANLSEVYRLHIGVPLEEQPHVVGGIGYNSVRLPADDHFYIGILFLKELRHKLRNYAGELAVMLLLEALHV